MSDQTATALLRKAIANPDLPVPAVVQRRAAVIARRNRDKNLLVALIARADAPADLVADYANEADARARVAYLSRPDASAEQVRAALASEGRVTVLAALAANEAAPPFAFTALAEQMVARNSTRLADALITGPGTPDRVRLEAIVFRAAAIGSSAWTPAINLQNAVKALPDTVVDEAVRSLPAWACVLLTARDGLSGATRRRLVADVVVPALAGSTSPIGQSRTPTEFVEELLERADLQLEVLVDLHAALSSPAVSPSAMDSGVRRRALADLEERSGGLLKDVTEQGRRERAAVLADASDPGADPVVLSGHAERALADTDRVLALALVTNPATPATSAATLVPVLDVAVDAGKVWRAQTGPGRDPVRVALLAAWPHLLEPTYDADPVARLDDLDDLPGACRELVPAWLGQCAGERDWVLHINAAFGALLAVSAVPGAVGAAAVAALPWLRLARFVQTHAGTHERRAQGAQGVLLRMQAEVLGDREERWVTYERLAEGFGGTVGELFETVAAIAG